MTSSPTSPPSSNDMIVAAAQVVSAYIVNRPHESFNLTALLADVYGTLSKLAAPTLQSTASLVAATMPQPNRLPVVAVEDSVKADYLVCLEDGKRVKMLKRHLKTVYNMSPEQYRARWNLPSDYPMVAPNYAQVRSHLAKQIGLGRRSTKPLHHALPTAKQRMDMAALTLRQQ